MNKILFVCHGNICRSTMAEFVMKELVRRAGMEEAILVASAACRRDELGSDTHWGTKEKLRQEGIPFTPRRAVQVQRADYEKYDYLIGMDRENLRDLMELTDNDPQHKISLLLSFAGEEREVADPWYTGDFSATYEDVQRGCQALLVKLKHQESI